MHLARDLQKTAFPLFDRIRLGHKDFSTFAYYLEYLVFHLPEPRLVPALEWLIKNRLTHSRFLAFIENECHSSALEFMRYITARLEKEKSLRVLTVGDMQT